MTDNLQHSDSALAERAPVGWSFWLWWVLATFVGLAAGLAATGAVFGPITGGLLVWLLRQPAPRGGEATEA